MDGVKVALGNRGMTVEAKRQCVKDRNDWRALVHMELNEELNICTKQHMEINVPSDRPPVLWGYLTWRGAGCRYMMRMA